MAENGETRINKHIFVWVGSFVFGGFGVDRFLRGQIALGVVKLLLGWLTFGIWALVDWIIAIVKAYTDNPAVEGDDLIFVNGAYKN